MWALEFYSLLTYFNTALRKKAKFTYVQDIAVRFMGHVSFLLTRKVGERPDMQGDFTK